MKQKRRLIALILVAVLIMLSTTTVNAATKKEKAVSYGSNGYHCNKENTASGNLLVGDSRTCQLWYYNNSGASFVSVWGGHYGYGGSTGQIDTKTQRTDMKQYAKDTIKELGYCNIYIFATVNDYNGGDQYKSAANNVYNLAQTAYGWTQKYNKKTVHPTVYVVSLVGGKGKDVSKYNTYLSGKIAKSKKISGFIDISDCLTGSNSGYLSDNLHYSDTTLKNIWGKIN
jgi:hypothetical protein